ncbi:MAG TPA: hypothetical protein VIK64_12270 [Anaerolineales bacterium]
MTNKPDFDVQDAHKFFSAYCFNKAWEFIEKENRSPQEAEEMIRLSHASHWHWAQREDYGARNASIAYWQTSRIYALLGQSENAERYAQLCLEASQADDLDPFLLGYAYEALARAEAVAGKHERATAYLKQARAAAEEVHDQEDRQLLLSDLETIL